MGPHNTWFLFIIHNFVGESKPFSHINPMLGLLASMFHKPNGAQIDQEWTKMDQD